METTKQTPTPELDKMLANKEQSQAIGEFLDWLQSEKKIVFSKHEPESINYFDPDFKKKIMRVGENSDEAKELKWNNTDKWEHTGGLMPFYVTIEKLLAEYFGVDLNKAEKEKQSLLEGLIKKS